MAQEYVAVGELSEESRPSKYIFWRIPNFNELSEKIDFWIYSPSFTLAHATWCLQMFPNGQTQENTNGWIDLLLLRLHSNNSSHLVWCELGIITCEAKIHESFDDINVFKDRDVEWGVAHLMKRSDTVKNSRLISKEGVLTVFCEIQISKEKTDPSLFESARNLPVLKMPEHLKVGELLEQEIPSCDITWTIPGASLMLDYQSSPCFSFADASWCLQAYLVNEENEGEDASLGLRLCSTPLKYDTDFTLGIKNPFGEIYDSFRGKKLKKKTSKWNYVKLFKYSNEEKYSIVTPNVTAFCQMYMKENIQNYFFKSVGLVSEDVMEKQSPSGLKTSTWTIYSFPSLSTDIGYFIDSSEFSFANARWCLRLYPNGQKEDHEENMHLFLVRLESCNTEHQIHCKLGFMMETKKTETFIHAVSFNENVAEVGIFLKRSYAIKSMNALNNVTFSCDVIKAEEVGGVIPSLKEKKLSSALMTSAGAQMFPPSAPKVCLWPIDISQLSVSEDYFVCSQEFTIANATWCMKMYPFGRKRGDGWIHLFLVRLRSSHSYHRINFRLGLKVTKETKKRKKIYNKDISSTLSVVFYANNIEMGVVNFPRGIFFSARVQKNILVAYCSIFFIEEINLLLAEPSSRFKETMGILDHSQQLYTETALSGKENIKWKLKFSELPTEEDNFIDSTEFFFADAIWCLRIYPCGKKGDHNDCMQLFLLRLQSQCPDHHIHYRLGLKLRGDKERASFIHEAYFHRNGAESGVVNLLKISEVLYSHKLYLPEGILTVFCEILLDDDLTAALSNQPKCSQPIAVEPLQILKSSQQSPTTSVDSLGDGLMLLDIKMFSAIPTNFNYFIESEKFVMANATWCIRLYPNGKKQKEEDTNDWMHLLLVRLICDSSHHSIHYKVGLMKHSKPKGRKRDKNKRELHYFMHVANIHKNGLEVGITNLIKRSEVMKAKDIFLPEDTLTAFCQVQIIEEKIHSLSNPTNCPELAYDSSTLQIEMSKYFSFGVITQKSGLDTKDVIWKLLSANVVSLEIGYAIDSPLFLFMNEYWGLRMYVCAEKSNNLYGSLQLYLLRLNNLSSFSYEVNLKTLINDSWKDFETIFSNGICNKSVIELGLTDIHFASDGYLTIHCQLIIFSEGKETFMPSKSQKPFKDYSLDFSRSKVQCGILHELSFLKSAEITWNTFDFSGFEKKFGLYVNSPTFELAKNTWMLQLYPNGLKRKSEQMCIILIRLFSNAKDCDVTCEIYDKNSKSKVILGKIISTFRGKCIKSCPAVLDLPIFRQSNSTEPLSLLCRLFISESSKEAYFETPLIAENQKPVSTRQIQQNNNRKLHY